MATPFQLSALWSGASRRRRDKVMQMLVDDFILQEGRSVVMVVTASTERHCCSKLVVSVEGLSQPLLGEGADVEMQNEGWTPEDVATAASNPEIVAMIQAEAVRKAKCVAFAMEPQERAETRLLLGSGILGPGAHLEESHELLLCFLQTPLL
jgi:hypothetical protein